MKKNFERLMSALHALDGALVEQEKILDSMIVTLAAFRLADRPTEAGIRE